MNGILECTSHFVVLLVFLELLLLLFEGGQPLLDGFQELFDLFTLALGFLQDLARFFPALVVHTGAGDLAQ